MGDLKKMKQGDTFSSLSMLWITATVEACTIEISRFDKCSYSVFICYVFRHLFVGGFCSGIESLVSLAIHSIKTLVNGLHRVLQPENLLLDRFGVLKVSDFGLSALSKQVQVSTVNMPLIQRERGGYGERVKSYTALLKQIDLGERHLIY